MEQGESKANVVKGNVLRLCVELTLRTLESVGANVESSEVAFVPKAGSVTARLADGARVVTMQVEGVEENRVTLADHGTLLPGEYSLEILCRDELDNPYRYMKRCAVEVHDATACAGIEAGVEFDAQVQYLGATFTQVIDGSGTPIDLGNYYTKDEIDTLLRNAIGSAGIGGQFVVTITKTVEFDDERYSADKTASQIYEAHQSGKNVIAKYGDSVGQLLYCESGNIVFLFAEMGDGLKTPLLVCNDDLWWVEEQEGGGSGDSGYSVTFDNGNVIFSGSNQPTYDNGNIIF